MAGLRLKFFTFDEKHHVATNFYADRRLRGDSPDGRQRDLIAPGSARGPEPLGGGGDPKVLVPVAGMCQHRGALALFGKRAGSLDSDDGEAAAVDLERIARGGIPLGAEQRLKRIAAGESAVFSSDLSVKEYAMAQTSGLTPIAQIMGSSVVQTGWQNYGGASQLGQIVEVPSFAEPWNLSRQRSFDRLRQEAQFAGADAVIGIEMTTRTLPGGQGNVEYLVFGTAVREDPPTRRSRSGPRMCALSGQDVVKLRQIGAETVGVIGHTSVVGVSLSGWANQMMGSWWGNQEMTEITQGVYMARRLAMDEVRRQGNAAGANEMVISELTHRIDHAGDGGGRAQHVFFISMHVLGTAIVLGAHEPYPKPLGVPVMSINLGA
jgi:uncharacterized protein YbjQ (UPF0145 family)